MYGFWVRDFRQDERGGVAIMFGLIVIVLAMFSGLAIDYSRLILAKRTLQDCADAAALAAGRTLVNGSSSAEADAIVVGKAYFADNGRQLSKAGTDAPIPDVFPDKNTNTVVVQAQGTVPLTFMALGGYSSITIPVSSTVTFDNKDIEVGMALDITGSMDQYPPGGGPKKIDGLKIAFKKFVETLVPSTPQATHLVRVGVAPFSASVNLGAYAKDASNSLSKDGCVTERSVASYDDKSPVNGGYFDVAADGVKNIDPTEGGVGSARYFCPGPTIMPLTSDRQSLIDAVNNFSPGGYTAGHLGVQWGWNLISPDFGSFWGGTSQPASYSLTLGSKPKLLKAMILMTDGIFNTAYHDDIARKQALAMCTAMKKQGVLVFTIGFGLANTGLEAVAKQTLRDCATLGPQFFADASSTNDLDAALQQFATVLGKLRISQ